MNKKFAKTVVPKQFDSGINCCTSRHDKIIYPGESVILEFYDFGDGELKWLGGAYCCEDCLNREFFDERPVVEKMDVVWEPKLRKEMN